MAGRSGCEASSPGRPGSGSGRQPPIVRCWRATEGYVTTTIIVCGRGDVQMWRHCSALAGSADPAACYCLLLLGCLCRCFFPQLLDSAANAGPCSTNSSGAAQQRQAVLIPQQQIQQARELASKHFTLLQAGAATGRRHHGTTIPVSASFVKPTAVRTDSPSTPARTGTWMPRGM